ncbi:serine hydrolase [Ferruginibacter sp. SUN106]|uniref:serine hydrolase n=1 Tax=Ferruginibacter sp. SUN106 TaxID=2978348 RepID=UPI003D35A1D0
MQLYRNSGIRGLVLLFFLAACSPTKKVVTQAEMPPVAVIPPVAPTAPVMPDLSKTDSQLTNLLMQYPAFFDSILIHKKDWNVQIIYTQVNRGANGVPALKNYYFNVNPANYFYPASTVKFPIALLALQKLNELKDKGIDKNTTMITEVGNNQQTAVYNDPTTIDGKPTIAQYIKKILMVSDNDAFNRLYEFLGQEYINKKLNKKGYDDVQILHRLDIVLPELANRQTNPIKFLDGTGNILYQQPLQNNMSQYAVRNDSLGKSFYRGGNLVNGPMDFSKKNRISLEDLHNILVSLVFPERVTASQRFNITEDDRKFVLKYMSQLPTESTFPPYSADTLTYFPAYCKFLLLGGDPSASLKAMPGNIRIFNKPGDAYGHMLDVAYIVDYDKGVEFFLSAVIYCNSDGTLNDDKYDYKTTGLPFMKNLGQIIYNYEVKRPKQFLPDLSDFKFIYDKQ